MLDDLKNIQIADYDYPLPDERIARYPMERRDHSKLLCLKDGTLSEHRFYDLPSLLPQDSLLVFNDTRVIHARLLFRKETGATIEIFCLEPHHMAVSEAFEQREQCSWVCMVGNNKRWRGGDLHGQCLVAGQLCTFTATRRDAEGNTWVIDFRWSGGFSFAEVIENAGVIPLPPARPITVGASLRGWYSKFPAGCFTSPTIPSADVAERMGWVFMRLGRYFAKAFAKRTTASSLR